MVKANDKVFEETSIVTTQSKIHNVARAAIAITLQNTTYAEVSSAFVDNITLEVKSTSLKQRFLVDNPSTYYSAYSVAGDITDHRDGTITVIMGAKTPYELAQERIAKLEQENAEMLFQNLTGEDFEE